MNKPAVSLQRRVESPGGAMDRRDDALSRLVAWRLRCKIAIAIAIDCSRQTETTGRDQRQALHVAT